MVRYGGDFTVRVDFHPLLCELAMRIRAELLSQFRQNNLTWTDQDNPEHVFSEVREKPHRLPQEVIHGRDRFDSGESASSHDKIQ